LPILGRLDRGGFGSLSKGRPAFAEAASRRQAEVALPIQITWFLSRVALTPTLSPAFAEAASRRQAPGEREIIRVFSTELRLKNGMEFVMNKNPVSFLVNAEEGNDDSFF
jgi:hypothetical protein